ncbi:hypothetical protein MWU59_00010 [Flavobacteriaceae bacterium F08102]|nr:hypothetical protein [Flavobacteriaceae bacterium F08102]
MMHNLKAQTRGVFDTLSRTVLIEQALQLVDPPLDTSYFHAVKVMASADEVFVSFENPIIYLPMKSEYYYEVLVDLTNEVVSYDSRSNPEDYTSPHPLTYFKMSPAHEKDVLFALNAVHKTNASLAAYYQSLNGTRYLILPNEKNIRVWMMSDYQEVEYEVDRTSGEVKELYKADLESDLFFGSDFFEVKN